MEKISSGQKPKLLIHSGTHGDEFEIIQLIKECLQKFERHLPSYVYVPEVSPSAVKNKTRKNGAGIDMNRQFFSDSVDTEVKKNIQMIKDQKFDLFVSFHEDPGENNYYLYDVGYRRSKNKLVLKHNDRLKRLGIGLLNGVDDPTDPQLGYEFIEGYLKLTHPEKYKDDGTISAWVLNRHIADTYLLPEIPGKASIKVKRTIVESFFTDVLLKSF